MFIGGGDLNMGSYYVRCDVCENPENDFSIRERNVGSSGHKTNKAAIEAGWELIQKPYENNFAYHSQPYIHVCPVCQSLGNEVKNGN